MKLSLYFIMLLAIASTGCTTLHQVPAHKQIHQVNRQNHSSVTLKHNHSSVKTVHVVHYSWHSGIIIKKSDIPAYLIPEKADFPRAEFIEIGWGNKAFYQAQEFKLDVAMKALFIPGPSVMYVYGFNNQPAKEYLNAKIATLYFSSVSFNQLLRTINDTFDRKGQERAPATLILTDRNARFYDALGSYSVANTCNIWTAKVLKSGGVPVSTSMYSMSAYSVMSQIETNHPALY